MMTKGVGRGVGGGRKPKRKDAPLSRSQTFRLSASLDDHLREAAAKSGRTISEEIQFRLELTFGFRPYLGPTIESVRRSILAAENADHRLLLAISDIVRQDHPHLDPIHNALVEASATGTPQKEEEGK